MTNPAEKIRQVVEEAKNWQEDISWDGDIPQLLVAHQMKLLDTLAEIATAKEESYADMIADLNNRQDYSAASMAMGRSLSFGEIGNMLKEARSSLDGGGKSITNSTHE